VPSASTYVFVADSAYTERVQSAQCPCGAESSILYRNDGSNLPTNAMCGRHNGVANIAFLDGHIGDSMDRRGLFTQSYIAVLCDAGGYQLGEIYK